MVAIPTLMAAIDVSGVHSGAWLKKIGDLSVFGEVTPTLLDETTEAIKERM